MTLALLESPVIIQTWNGESHVLIRPRFESLYPAPPRIGMVIGTYAAVPYIHLQLEAHRRLYPQVPLLIHDDGSHRSEELHELCRKYECDFEYNGHRQQQFIGDLTAFVGGLQWATSRKLDILLKVSRRWVFLVDWERSLKALALQSQYPTFCSYTKSFGFGFRTECVAMAVAVWSNADFMEDAKNRILQGEGLFMESYIHSFSLRYERRNCPAAEAYRESHPMASERGGYALWTLMGTDRCERSPFFLWHDSCSPEDYLAVSRDWGLPYTLADFVDPNQGGGDGR